MSKTTLSAAARSLLDYIETHDDVSFVEATRVLGEHLDTTGTLGLHVPGFDNVLLWDGLSREAVDVLKELMESKQAHWRHTGALVYWVDGEILDYPIAKSLRPYKSPRWLPGVLCSGPDPNATPGEGARS